MLQRICPLILILLTKASYADLRADGHAPAGMMFEHMHEQGMMLGYRVQQVTQQGSLLNGSQILLPQDSLLNKYSMLPQKHTMIMHMLDIMYVPTRNLNLMIMPMYMDMGMSMQMNANYAGSSSGHGGHGGGSHDVKGLGDTTLAAMYQVYKDNQHELITTLAVIAPTGDEKVIGNDGKAVHYGMQLGAGVWQAMPSITYSYKEDRLSLGVQALTKQALADTNKIGVRVSDMNQFSTWLAFAWQPQLTSSVRLQYSKTDSIGGHYNIAHHHSSPPDIQKNYGGEQLFWGVGVNWLVTTGVLKGLRVGIEYVEPVNENLNGVQLATKRQLYTAISKAF